MPTTGPALVVLAAGVGSRFGGMKQVAGVGPGNHALMDYSVYDALRSGFDCIVMIVSDASEPAVRAHAEAGFARAVDVRFARQDSGDRAKPWGTGHAVLTARPEVDPSASIGVVNADDFYGRRSFAVLQEGLAAEDPAHVLVGYTLRDTLSPHGGVSRGMAIVDGPWLRTVTELYGVQNVDGRITTRDGDGGPALTGEEVISTNLWGFRPAIFESLTTAFAAFVDAGPSPKDEFLIAVGVDDAVNRGPGVRVLTTPDPFFGVTYQEDVPDVRARLEDLVRRGEYPERLWD